jgi:hypothetical protein
MSRRIVATVEQAAGGSKRLDRYPDRLLKYIPADIVAAWIAITGLINITTDVPASTTNVPNLDMAMWIVFIVMVGITAAWIWRQTSEPGEPPAVTHIVIATGAFIVWVLALGGRPFSTLPFYHPLYGSLVLILYTLLVPLIIPRE